MKALQKLIAQFMKFGVVGIIAFFIDYGLLIFCTEILHIPYLVSATIGFTVSVIFNYVASMRFVFRHKEDMSRTKELIIFVVLSVIGLGLNDGLMWLGVDGLGWHYMLVKIGATAIVMVWNFVTRKLFLDAGEPEEEEEGSSTSLRIDTDAAEGDEAPDWEEMLDASAENKEYDDGDAELKFAPPKQDAEIKRPEPVRDVPEEPDTEEKEWWQGEHYDPAFDETVADILDD